MLVRIIDYAKSSSWYLEFFTLFLMTGLFTVYKTVFLLSYVNSIFLAFLPFWLYLFYSKRKGYIKHISFSRRKGDFKYYFIFVFALFSIFIFINSIFLLRYYYFYADDWGLFHRFLESKNLWSSIIERYNHHPSYLLNGILAFNLFKLDGQTFIPILLNTLALFSISIIFFNVIFNTLKATLSPFPTIALSLTLMVFTFWMSDGVAAFWSIGFLPVLGAILATYGLVHNHMWSNYKGVFIYFLGSMIISLCTGFGAAIWWVIFFYSIIKKQTKTSLLISFLIGLLGSLLTLGVFAFSQTNLQSPDLTTLFLALPAFLGAPTMVGFVAFFSEDQLVIPSIFIGVLGLTLFLYYLYDYYKCQKKEKKNIQGKLFFLLLCVFVGGCSFLIAFGRMENNILVIMRGQYFLWSTIFWFSIVGLSFIHITENEYLKKIVNLPFYFSLTLLVTIFLFNLLRIDHRLNYYSSNVKGIIDIIINPDSHGNEKLLLHAKLDYPDLRKMVHEVKEEIKKREINIFSHDWAHLISRRFSQNCKTINSSLYGNFKMNSDGVDSFIEGNLSSSSFYDVLPEALIITYNDTIIGLGLPISNIENREIKSPAPYNLFNILPRPFGLFPGVSNYYFCQLKPSLNGYIPTKLKLYGIDEINAREISNSF